MGPPPKQIETAGIIICLMAGAGLTGLVRLVVLNELVLVIVALVVVIIKSNYLSTK